MVQGRPILQLVTMAGAAAVLLTVPAYLSQYWVFVFTSVFMYVIVTLGINLITGYAGYPAFGNSVFFGIGAYGIAVLSGTLGLPLSVGLTGAIALAVAMVLVVGAPVLRAKGHYFAIATVGLNEATKQIVTNLEITGGAKGIAAPVLRYSAEVLGYGFYYSMLAAMVLSIAVMAWVSRSSFGYALQAIRENEDAAEAMGIPTVRVKTQAWALSAALTSLAGAIWGVWIGFFEPQSAFDIMVAIKGFIMMLLGGMATVWGPVIGAVGLEMLSRTVWGNFFNVHRLVLGVLIVAVILLMPQGFVALWKSRGTWLERGKPVWRSLLKVRP